MSVALSSELFHKPKLLFFFQMNLFYFEKLEMMLCPPTLPAPSFFLTFSICSGCPTFPQIFTQSKKSLDALLCFQDFTLLLLRFSLKKIEVLLPRQCCVLILSWVPQFFKSLGQSIDSVLSFDFSFLVPWKVLVGHKL